MMPTLEEVNSAEFSAVLFTCKMTAESLGTNTGEDRASWRMDQPYWGGERQKESEVSR